MLYIISFVHFCDLCDAQAPGEKKKKNLFGKKLSFTKGKERIGSEDTLSGDDCELIVSYICNRGVHGPTRPRRLHTRPHRLHTHPHTESDPSPPVPVKTLILPHPSHRFFCHRTKGGNNSHRSGKTGNLLKIPHITNSLVSFYTRQYVSLVCLNIVCPPKFFTAEFVDHSRGVHAKKIYPRGIPATFRPIPAGNPRILRDSRRPHPRAYL